MTPSSCGRCGATFDREIPAGLAEPWRGMLERTPPVCPTCVERMEAEDEQHELERQAQERAERVLRRREGSGVPLLLRGVSWTDVADTAPRPLFAARAWGAGDLSGLLLAGPVGVGKTSLAAAAAWTRLEHAPLRWLSVPELFSRLALAFGDETREDALKSLAGSQGLVLDDVDKARPSEYAAEQMFYAIDNRVTAGAQLLVTTNLELSELAARFPQPHGAAIVSRLAGYCDAFALDGQDRRLERFAS
jgi:DNA replication protein DnaC